ncbi:MAG: YwaF family protein [Erysipelotrichaceae bacterium]|nr:YwaF family protein [Erysipelotrichaceae bacterium]
MKKIRITPFSLPWFGWLAICAAALVLMRVFIYPLDLQVRLNVLLWIGIISFGCLRIYKFGLRFLKGYDYNYFNELPFYLCNMSTFTCIYAALTNSHIFAVYSYSVGFAGALLAFLAPDPSFRDIDLFSWKSFGFFGYHTLLIINCLGFTVLDICRPQLVDVFGVVGITLGLMLLAHAVNFTVRKLKLCEEANYVFTYDPGDNGILLYFYKKIPIPAVYLLPLAAHFALIYLIMYAVYRLFALIL